MAKAMFRCSKASLRLQQRGKSTKQGIGTPEINRVTKQGEPDACEGRRIGAKYAF